MIVTKIENFWNTEIIVGFLVQEVLCTSLNSQNLIGVRF